MKILIGGASGLIGSALVSALEAQQHQIVRLVRRAARNPGTEIEWDPSAQKIAADPIPAFDAVIHLSGETIGGFRWSAAKKSAIHDSRVLSTRLICNAICNAPVPPKTWLCASAVGYYGSRGGDYLTEAAAPGEGFLAQVCKDWEAETKPATEKVVRVVNMRFGVVLAKDGGPLALMLPPFKLGVGGVVGSGNQYFSWIAHEDVVKAILFLLDHPEVHGPVNITAPNPVTNRELTHALGRALHRPTILPMPAFAARAVMGELADELLLASTRALPEKLETAGFEFTYPEIDAALHHVLQN